MSDALTILRTAYYGLRGELERIQYWLTGSEELPLGKYAQPISSRLSDLQRDAATLLYQMGQAIEPPAPPAQGAADWQPDPEAAWSAYRTLKREVMPVLASELLAVIGGAFLMKDKLDTMGGTSLSFSDLAQTLVTNLGWRSKGGWESVLIVSEERIGYLQAEIIRLRFPACDIWNLPFAAHEYGYLVGENRNLKLFSDFRKRVGELVDPRPRNDAGEPVIADRQPPPDYLCFLPEVRSFWARYDTEQVINEVDLKELTKRQVAHLCRLFADAFATFFVGPAYVHALLQLRFFPDDSLYAPTPSMPAFAHRFVFALETLKWMDGWAEMYSNLGFDLKKIGTPFRREVEESQGIFPVLWRQTIDATKQDDDYTTIAETYCPWLKQVKRALHENYWHSLIAGVQTYRNWLTATTVLEEKIASPQQLQIEAAHPVESWAILNAAWSARANNPGSVKRIEEHALLLLDPEKQAKVRVPPKAGSGEARSGATREEQISLVEKALAVHMPALLQFTKMKESGKYELTATILEVIKDRPVERVAYLAFWYIGRVTGTGDMKYGREGFWRGRSRRPPERGCGSNRTAGAGHSTRRAAPLRADG